MWVFPRPQGTKKDVTYVGFKFWFVGVGQDRQQFDDGIRIPSISLFLLPKCEAQLYAVGLLPSGSCTNTCDSTLRVLLNAVPVVKTNMAK